MKRKLAIVLRIIGVLIALCGVFFIHDGLLPMRSHGPNPLWSEVYLGLLVGSTGLIVWLLASWVLRGLARRDHQSEAPRP